MGYNNDQFSRKTFWAGQIDNLPDPVRSTRWRMIIPTDIFKLIGVETTNGDSFGIDGGDDDFTLHINKGLKIPAVKTKDASIKYMGFEKYYPTQQDGLANTISMECLLLEDMRAYEAMLAWNQTCFNQGILARSPGAMVPDNDRTSVEGNNNIYLGLGQQENHNNLYAKLLRNACVRLELYDWNYGNVILTVVFENAWPKAVDASSFGLDYDQAKLGTFKVEFRYDRFNLHIPKGYGVI
ncbi:MAG: hypothetical protein MJZ25_03750 [Fibrobacter sp.]|nr:hypothetical protein [Fibrobacter sp.]